jgi:ferredoxin--NADP+ reductase
MAKLVDYNATVISRVDINPFLIILGIKPDQQPYPFKAGQYTVVGLKASTARVKESAPEVSPKTGDAVIQRAYSIASANNAGQLDFYLALVSHGELTPRLFTLQKNDRVYIGPKATGVFTLDSVAPSKSLLLMATGTGLAPYISMLRSQMNDLKNRKVVVLHGVRHSGDLGYREELEELAHKHSNIIYMPVISQPAKDPTWTGLTGYLQESLFSGEVEKRTGLQIKPDNFDAFICGNPSMIESTIAKLSAVGFVLIKGRNPGNIHIEEYW